MSADFHRMLAEFFSELGFSATFQRSLPGIPNDDDGTVSADSEEFPIRCIKMDVFGNMAGSRTKLSTLIQEADQVLYVQPRAELVGLADSEFTDDRVLIKGNTWKIVALKEYDPSAENCVLYELYIKR